MRSLVANGYIGRLLVMEAKINMGSLIRGEVWWGPKRGCFLFSRR